MPFQGFTNEDATISIGTTLVAETVQEFDGDTYLELGTFESTPEHGSQSNVVTASPLKGGEIARKGLRAYPESTFDMLYEPGSEGIQKLVEAEQDRNPYNLKIEFPDLGEGVDPHGTIHYVRALITGLTWPSGTVDEFARVTVGIKMVSPVVIKAASEDEA